MGAPTCYAAPSPWGSLVPLQKCGAHNRGQFEHLGWVTPSGSTEGSPSVCGGLAHAELCGLSPLSPQTLDCSPPPAPHPELSEHGQAAGYGLGLL